MGVKTDELNFKQHNCPFCNKKYFNVITLKGHLTLAHKDRVDGADGGMQDADDGGNEDLIGGVGGKYSNLIVNNPLVPIPNLEAGPVFSSLATSPLKVALQQQQQQQQLMTIPENPVALDDSPVALPQPVTPGNNSVTNTATQSSVTVTYVNKSKSRKKSRGKSPVAPTAGTTAALTRSLRNNPRSSRYHYDDDFCSGEDLDIFEVRLPRSTSEKSDRQTRSSVKADRGDGNPRVKGGEVVAKGKHILSDDDADSDATDDLTVDESAAAGVHGEGHQKLDRSNSLSAGPETVIHLRHGAVQPANNSEQDDVFLNYKISPILVSTSSLVAATSGECIIKEAVAPTAYIGEELQTSELSRNIISETTYASLQPVESSPLKRIFAKEMDQVNVAGLDHASRSAKNKFIIKNLLSESKLSDTCGGSRKVVGRGTGSENDSDYNEDFLTNNDSSLDGVRDGDESNSSIIKTSTKNTSAGSFQNLPSSTSAALSNVDSQSLFVPTERSKSTKVERSKVAKLEQSSLFSATYEKNSRPDRKEMSESSPIFMQTDPDLRDAGVDEPCAEDGRLQESRSRSRPPEDATSLKEAPTAGSDPSTADGDLGRVCSDVVMDIKKRTILKKLSNSLNMANKRQPSTIGGNKFCK